MNILKKLLTYSIWILLALLSGYGLMYVVLGPKSKHSSGFMKTLDWTHDAALVFTGSIIGGITALLYILLDVFYLNRKLKNHKTSILIRGLLIIIITIIAGTIYYLLEKTIDII